MDYSREDMTGLDSLNFDMPHFNEEGLLQLQEESYEGIGELDLRGTNRSPGSCKLHRLSGNEEAACMGWMCARLPLINCCCPSGDFFCIGSWWPRIEFIFKIRYKRYVWTIMKTYQKMKYFLRKLRYLESLDLSPEVRAKLKVAQETRYVYLALLCGGTREAKYIFRAENMCEIIQYIVDNPLLWNCVQVREFLEIGPNSFDPFYGDKGPEGYLWKISGGYQAGFSRSTGDYVSVGNRRWVSFSPTNYLVPFPYTR